MSSSDNPEGRFRRLREILTAPPAPPKPSPPVSSRSVEIRKDRGAPPADPGKLALLRRRVGDKPAIHDGSAAAVVSGESPESAHTLEELILHLLGSGAIKPEDLVDQNATDSPTSRLFAQLVAMHMDRRKFLGGSISMALRPGLPANAGISLPPTPSANFDPIAQAGQVISAMEHWRDSAHIISKPADTEPETREDVVANMKPRLPEIIRKHREQIDMLAESLPGFETVGDLKKALEQSPGISENEIRLYFRQMLCMASTGPRGRQDIIIHTDALVSKCFERFRNETLESRLAHIASLAYENFGVVLTGFPKHVLERAQLHKLQPTVILPRQIPATSEEAQLEAEILNNQNADLSTILDETDITLIHDLRGRFTFSTPSSGIWGYLFTPTADYSRIERLQYAIERLYAGALDSIDGLQAMPGDHPDIGRYSLVFDPSRDPENPDVRKLEADLLAHLKREYEEELWR